MNTILTKEYLETEYLKNKLSVRSIAKKTGFSYPYLQAKIKKLGIPRRGQYIDLAGKPFHFLTPMRFVGIDKRHQAIWECKCKCGNTKIVRANRLTLGETKSCGCARKTGFEEISGRHFANIKSHSKRGKILFTIKIEDIWNLYLKQNRKCALSGVDIVFSKKRGETTASLDRIDSSKGYTLDNVQWVHKEINQMKSDRHIKSFLWWVKTVFNHKKTEIELL